MLIPREDSGASVVGSSSQISYLASFAGVLSFSFQLGAEIMNVYGRATFLKS